MNNLTLEQADLIASGVFNCIKRNRFAPITVHVVNQEGVPYQRTNDGRIIHKNPKPIIISSGNLTGAGLAA